ncbi:MAG: hypothetical protein C5B46_09790 [Proteobacteria bacterium]|nr:MAG: hypothetical protein C5B46_09790 [Pseudomonadota bacterium]
MAAIATSAPIGVTHADGAAPPSQRRLLGELKEGAPPPPCALPNCATILMVHRHEAWEPAAPISAHGLSRNPPFGAVNPHAPIYTQPSSVVQQRKEVWIIEVRKRDGAVMVLEQSYPALFQPGDEVLIEGDRVRAQP